MTSAPAAPARRRSRRRKVLLWVIAAVAAVSLASSLSPWPSALLIRAVFDMGGAATVSEMLPYAPTTGLDEKLDQPYGDRGADTTLDVFTPTGGTEALPTVVWVHGGAWISGSKADVAPYLRILAAEGYTTVGLNYTVAPDGTLPLAFEQLNDALKYLVANAERLRINPDRIILAGDSAGAQLASQLAVLTTNPDYAQLIGIEPALSPGQLSGIILHCGVYDMDAMAELNGITNWGFKIALWGYTGTRDWSDTSAGTLMSSIDFVTPEFPPTFISGGNADGLTWIQSIPMFNKIKSQEVEVSSLFWPASYEPGLGHEYQFHLDLPEAHDALAETLSFLKKLG